MSEKKSTMKNDHLLFQELHRVQDLLARYAHDRRMLAMLARNSAGFAHSSQTVEARAIRDSVLVDECGKNADGTWIYFPPPEGS